MTLSISGVGYAGAGAYFDLLCEFNGVEHTPNLFELGILYEPDGVIDLVNKLKYNNSKITSYVPVRRFLKVSKFYTDFSWYKPFTGSFLYKYAEAFVGNLNPIHTSGYQYYELVNSTKIERAKAFINNSLLSKFNCLLKTKWQFSLEREMPICMDIENIDIYAKEFMCSILNEFRTTKNPHLLIKHICPPDMPEICLPYLPDDFRHISVNRDPRDLFILGRLNNTNDFPCRTVQEFVKYYKAIRDRQQPNPQVMFANFEDLCYRYEETVSMVKQFIANKNGWNKGRYFDPSKSVNNTRLVEKYPQYQSDVYYIEKSIPQYLYNYNNK